MEIESAAFLQSGVNALTIAVFLQLHFHFLNTRTWLFQRQGCDERSSALFSGEPRHYRGKVLHLSLVDLKVGETVAIALLKEMRNRLLNTEWSLWNWRPSCLGGESSATVGDLQVVDRLTQFQVCEAFPCCFFDPGNLLLQCGVCWVRTSPAYF